MRLSIILSVGIALGMAAPAAGRTADPLMAPTAPAAGPLHALHGGGTLAQARPATVRPRPAAAPATPARPFRMPWHVGVY